MASHHFVLATAGHVDHGKSALVKALTGIDPDRLPEEKARGMTIDLGFAHLPLPAGTLGIVDVPGHEDFVKNMVAGVGFIDVALLVVAADDGWMPQTEEHLQILLYLGVTRAVIALTKIDLAEGKEEARAAAVRARVSDSPIAAAPIVPTSIVSGRGLAELKATLLKVLEGAPPPRDIGKPRLPVDRVFSLHGIGTVVTGTLAGGSFHQGQTVVIQPSALATRIRSLQSHHQSVPACGPGTRTALNLAEVAVAPKGSGPGSQNRVRRGEVITVPGLGAASDTLDVWLERSARTAGSRTGGNRAVPDGAWVRVHHGTANVTARVMVASRSQLNPGEGAFAQLRLESSLFAFVGDRFIVRDVGEQSTLAGGTVLDPEAPRSRFRQSARQKFLRDRAKAMSDATACVSTQLERDGVARRAGLLLKSHFSAAEIATAVARLAESGRAVLAGELVVGAGFWSLLRGRATSAVGDWHRKHPEQVGLPLERLRGALAGPAVGPELCDAMVRHLLENGFVQAGSAIMQAGHQPALPSELQAAGARLRALLAARPLDPPSRKELAANAAARQALRFLRETGEVVEVSEELVLPAQAFAKLKSGVTEFLRSRGPATVSDLRQALGVSRRVMVPVLEKLDREGVTRRHGDQRRLASEG